MKSFNFYYSKFWNWFTSRMSGTPVGFCKFFVVCLELEQLAPDLTFHGCLTFPNIDKIPCKITCGINHLW